MPSQTTTAAWMGAAFAAAAAVAAVVLAVFGTAERGTDIALQATARLSFLLFWPAYAGSGLVALLGPAWQPLQRHGRTFGLAFASAHLVHVALVAWLCWIGPVPARGTFILFGPALVFIYLLALLSIRSLQQRLGRSGWWLLRTVAVNYIAYAFAADFLRYPLLGDAKHIAEYLPFAILSIAGPICYLASMTPLALRVRRAP